MVHGLFKIERHDLGTLGGDLLLTAGRRTEADAIEEAEHGYNAKNYDDNDGNTVVIFMPKTLIYRHPHAPFHSDTLTDLLLVFPVRSIS